MAERLPEKCFVVMPFGKKPLNDGSGRTYDFDKVYRVMMRRAIQQAGLEPIRADEHKGGNLIHTDMFKDLRDQKVVLADLSLHNPNVFYELGIRHVMSSKGTVLMCREGSELPFDVKLSRVIFYKYDGENLDWEVAEHVVQELQLALEEAQRGVPDSPVYALLEHVLSDNQTGADTVAGAIADEQDDEPVREYQKSVAEQWSQQQKSLDELIEQHGTSAFGARALGYFCLAQSPIPGGAAIVACKLYDHEQYDLACRIYEGAREGRQVELE